MRWRTGRRSTNVEDRRGMRPATIVGGGLGAVVLALIAMFLGVDPGLITQGDPSVESGAPTTAERGPRPDDELADFVRTTLGFTEDVWNRLFAEAGQEYREPVLVLFDGGVESACGFAQAAVGPFYCPNDQRLYIDLSFYRDMRDQLGAPGDFAQAYVIAHEVGHHVQTLLGVTQDVQAMRGRLSQADNNDLSVRVELQADCYSGVWAHHADQMRQIIEEGDVEEALNAAAAIGDDRLQRQSQGFVVPESFTHGSSAQRVRWFRRGLDTGDMQACDTFDTSQI